jgi:hypothetical protein
MKKEKRRRSVNYAEQQWHVHTWRKIGNPKKITNRYEHR